MGPKTTQNGVPKRPKWVPKRSYVDPGCLRASGGTFGTISEAFWGSLGGVRERLGRVLGDLGGVWGASCARLGAAWERLGVFWAVFGAFWRRCGAQRKSMKN